MAMKMPTIGNHIMMDISMAVVLSVSGEFVHRARATAACANCGVLRQMDNFSLPQTQRNG
jgi:hypothetical protein